MKQEDIILMAREAGLDWHRGWDDEGNRFEHFAALVAEAATEAANARATSSWTLMCKKMVAAENEACEKVCEPQEEHDDPLTAWKIAETIRARRQA